MLTIDQREITGPGTGAHFVDGRSSFSRIRWACHSLPSFPQAPDPWEWLLGQGAA